ncbi:hypothetical protein JTB14_002832 [Gonioctena quinquepunctata]|nr:hypothetical protein JTB14_002832 [Gonioctena quinquepunctata]
MTRTQRESALWKDERKIRLTASIFGKIMRGRSSDTLIKVAKDIVEPPAINVASINHGIINEDPAIREYELIQNIKVKKSGLQIHPQQQYLGASPDGLVEDDGLIEIKCPYTIRYNEPHQACRDNLIPYCDKDSGKLKQNHPYFYQVQDIKPRPKLHHFCLAVVDLSNGYFVFLNPTGSTSKETEQYLTKFLKYLEFYNSFSEKSIENIEWKTKLIKHDRQTDGYSCGVFVTYFLENIAKGNSLMNNVDIKEYRNYLKEILISSSDDVSRDCFYCGLSFNEKDCKTCSSCLRSSHIQCIRKNEYSTGLCDLCMQY